jgi:hypothetical protein
MLLEGGLAMKKKILITGATGQVGSKTLDFLLCDKEIEIVAAVRSPEKAAASTAKGIATVILDLDDESTHLPALKGIWTMRKKSECANAPLPEPGDTTIFISLDPEDIVALCCMMKLPDLPSSLPVKRSRATYPPEAVLPSLVAIISIRLVPSSAP